MNFLEKLDYMMHKLSINKSSLSQLSGVPYTTIDGFYKKGYENTKLSTIRKIAGALNVSLDYLIDDRIVDETYTSFSPLQAQKKNTPPCSGEALQLAKDYDALDHWGKQALRELADTELARMADETRFLEEVRDEPEEAKIIPLYLNPAAAGYASPIFGQEYEPYALRPEDPQGAEFAVRLQGDSMEPYFPDSSTVFCNRDPLADGDIGIFAVDGASVCKQYHYDRLLGITYLFSLNRSRSDADVVLPASSGRTLACLGRVITRKRYPLPHEVS